MKDEKDITEKDFKYCVYRAAMYCHFLRNGRQMFAVIPAIDVVTTKKRSQVKRLIKKSLKQAVERRH